MISLGGTTEGARQAHWDKGWESVTEFTQNSQLSPVGNTGVAWHNLFACI
jgi:hypothetical protein